MRGVVRTKNWLMSEDDCYDLIDSAENGVLATVNAEGQPCTTALNHVLIDHTLYFHSGLEGEKIDNLKVNPQVSYFIIGVADVIYDQFTTAFSSVVVNGVMEFVEDHDEKLRALTALVDRFSNELIPPQVKTDFIADGVNCVLILKLDAQNATGKARLSRKRPCLRY